MRRTKYSLVVGALCAALVLFLAPQVRGQAAFGTIIGTVTDPSGAGVAGAKVTATDTAKGVSMDTTTNESGNYIFTNITPGDYKITVEAKGFKTLVQANAPVIIGQSTTANVALEVGDVSQTVTVDAALPLMETDRAALKTDLTAEQVVSLPILDRNFTELELLLPGSEKMPWQHGQTENPQGGIQINTNGQLFSGTNFMIDGMDDTDPVLGIITVNPPIDSVEGFNATTSNFDPEFSQAGGVVVQVETKSGSNEIHGSGFEFYRNNIFEARDPFTQSPSAGVPGTHWNQYGASLGGPIKKEKIFYFFDYQGSRQQNSGSAAIRVPTAAERAGDFSDFILNLPASVTPLPIFDPTTGAANGTGRTQFNDPSRATASNPQGLNIIPAGRISTPAANLLATTFVPLPNCAPNCSTDPTAPNYFKSGVEQFNSNQVVLRIDDFKVTPKLRVFGRYNYGGYYLNSPGALGTAGGTQFSGIGFEGTTNARDQNGLGGLNYSFSPTLLADFRFGVTKYRVFVSAPDETQQLATQVGIPGINDPARPDTFGLPDFNINGAGGFQMGYQCNCPLNEQDREFQGVTNWTKIFRNHTFKVGADIRRRQNKRLPSDQHRAGRYEFNAGVTADGNSTSGLSLASFLVGDPSEFHRFSQISTSQQDLQWSMYYYGEDTWRITRKLTLNYGLRWDTWFADESLNAGQGGRYDATTNTAYIPGVGGVSQSGGVNTQYNNFSPRLGIAYSLNPKTVIRTGWGRSYFEGTFGWTFNTLAADVYPSIVNQDLTATSTFFPLEFSSAATPGTPVLANAPPAAVFPTVPSNGRLPLPNGIGDSSIPTNQKIPYVDSYNLTVERVVFTDATLSLGYVGNVGRHLNGGWQLNSAVPGPGTNFNLRRPLFIQFGLTQGIFNKCNCESSDYNALQAKFTKRFSRNYSVLASYTWSKSLDFGEFGTDTNQFNYRMDHGPAVFDRASIFTIGHTVLLPFGRGQRFGSDASSVLNAFIGGWEWTGITSVESGLPFEPSISNASLNSDMGIRPDKVGNPGAGVPHNQFGWFNAAAYAIPAAFTFGDASRNSLRGPGYFNADWGLDKNFRISERLKAQLRWEVFNAFNRANLASPDNNVTPGNTDAGKIHDVIGGNPGQISMRNQQIGLRLTW